MEANVALIGVIFTSFLVFFAGAQMNGDLRLVGGDSPRKGRVELFLGGTWGTIEVRGGILLSGTQRRRWAGHAICRQLGYRDSAERGDVGDLGLQPASNSVPVLIDDIFCGVRVTTTDGNGNTQTTERDSQHEHLLRCDYDVVSQPSIPDHDDDFAVECNEADSEGYNTEVRLVQGGTGFSSSGFVEVYLHDSYGPVCNMGTHDADTACRQLGYTNAASFGSDVSYQGSPASVSKFFCTSSERCLNSCFDTPAKANNASDCTKHSFVNCTFVVEDEGRFSGGTSPICSGLQRLIGIAVGSAFAGLVLLIAVVVVTVCCCCYCRAKVEADECTGCRCSCIVRRSRYNTNVYTSRTSDAETRYELEKEERKEKDDKEEKTLEDKVLERELLDARLQGTPV